MFDILAQATQTGVAVGGGIVGGSAFTLWLFKRTANKVLTHVENTKIHVSENNGYVSKSVCENQHDALLRELQDIKNTQETILKHLLS